MLRGSELSYRPALLTIGVGAVALVVGFGFAVVAMQDRAEDMHRAKIVAAEQTDRGNLYTVDFDRGREQFGPIATSLSVNGSSSTTNTAPFVISGQSTMDGSGGP